MRHLGTRKLASVPGLVLKPRDHLVGLRLAAYLEEVDDVPAHSTRRGSKPDCWMVLYALFL